MPKTDASIVTISVPYLERAYGDIHFTYDLPKGMTKEEFLKRLKDGSVDKDDEEFLWTKATKEEWVVKGVEVEKILYFEATIMEDN